LYERLILWSGFGSACIRAHQDNSKRADDRYKDTLVSILTLLWTACSTSHLANYLRAYFGFLPFVSLQSPLSPPVWLRLELEVLGAFCLDDDQGKVFKGSVDLFLLFGIVLILALATIR